MKVAIRVERRIFGDPSRVPMRIEFYARPYARRITAEWPNASSLASTPAGTSLRNCWRRSNSPRTGGY
jgi:hypothetical protein